MQFSGALPLEQQERFSEALKDARSKKHQLEEELEQVAHDRICLGDQVASLELRNAELRELTGALRNGTAAAKLGEWHQKMVDLRVNELQLTRMLGREQDQVQLQKTSIG